MICLCVFFSLSRARFMIIFFVVDGEKICYIVRRRVNVIFFLKIQRTHLLRDEMYSHFTYYYSGLLFLCIFQPNMAKNH